MHTTTTNVPAPPGRLRDLPEYLTISQAAKLLGLKRSRAYELVQRGQIATVRDGLSSTRYVHVDELRRLTSPQPA